MSTKNQLSHDTVQIDKSTFSKELPEWINEIFFYLENMGIDRKSIDWKYERQFVIEQYQTNISERELIQLLKNLITKAGSTHSFLIHYSAQENVNDYYQEVNEDTAEKISLQIVDNIWGYIPIATYYGGNETADAKIISKVNAVIQEAEKFPLQGLIIDLSQNEGGNMYPPLLGLTPLLDNGNLGFFYDPSDKTKIAWAHNNGSIETRDEQNVYWSLQNKDYYVSTLRDLPKAILVSHKTGSSGEFLLLSLASQKQTKVFGQTTAGFATGNEVLNLSDGSKLILTTVLSMDTKGQIYNNSITPDVITYDWISAKNEAISWLNSVDKNN